LWLEDIEEIVRILPIFIGNAAFEQVALGFLDNHVSWVRDVGVVWVVIDPHQVAEFQVNVSSGLFVVR
jgi:hypothetical protein